jgi:uncharacterized protein with HEPN domain
MSFDRSELYLDLIREAAENAAKFLRGMDKDDFLSDMKVRHAVAMCPIIVGENVSRLSQRSPEVLSAHPNVPWRQAIGLRNRIAHGYEGLNFEMIWSVATEYLPSLLAALPPAAPYDD